MNRNELKSFILESYGGEPDFPWLKYPSYEVFRHQSNQKWFALIMDIPKSKLGLPDTDVISVVNFKCDPILIGSFLQERGVFPAYHMSKTNWLTVALDGSASDDTIRFLLDFSYELTRSKPRRQKHE